AARPCARLPRRHLRRRSLVDDHGPAFESTARAAQFAEAEKIKLAPDSRMAKQEPRVPVHGDPGHWIHISESPRTVRIVFGGKTLADSKHVKLLREDGILPVYYFPASDVLTDLDRKSTRLNSSHLVIS